MPQDTELGVAKLDLNPKTSTTLLTALHPSGQHSCNHDVTPKLMQGSDLEPTKSRLLAPLASPLLRLG